MNNVAYNYSYLQSRRKKPIVYKTSKDFTRLPSPKHSRLPETMTYLESYLDGSYFLTAHSLGEVSGLGAANTTRLSNALGNFACRSSEKIGALFSLPMETILFCAADSKPKTTRHINVCTVAAAAILGSEKSSVPGIPGLGSAIIVPLIEALSRYPDETQEQFEKLLESTAKPRFL